MDNIKDLTPVRGQDGKISDIQGKDFWSPTRESGGRLPLPPIAQPIHSQPPCIVVIGLGVFLNWSKFMLEKHSLHAKVYACTSQDVIIL
jgi:hypothetical protein